MDKPTVEVEISLESFIIQYSEYMHDLLVVLTIKVSGTHVNGQGTTSCILLGYPELRVTKLLLEDNFYS